MVSILASHNPVMLNPPDIERRHSYIVIATVASQTS